jgi:hypothetical protein
MSQGPHEPFAPSAVEEAALSHAPIGEEAEQLEESPEEKRNATDGYAPADEGAETKTVDDLED